jgi:hypothetical protein
MNLVVSVSFYKIVSFSRVYKGCLVTGFCYRVFTDAMFVCVCVPDLLWPACNISYYWTDTCNNSALMM